MIAGPGVNICSDCVDLCADILAQKRDEIEKEGENSTTSQREG